LQEHVKQESLEVHIQSRYEKHLLHPFVSVQGHEHIFASPL